MADPNALGDAARLAVGGVTGAALVYMLGQFGGGLLKSWISGTGVQEKELRGDLAAEVKRLAADLSDARDQITELSRDTRQMNRMWVHMLTSRAEARGALNALQILHGLPPTVWPDDPKESLAGPAGGTP